VHIRRNWLAAGSGVFHQPLVRLSLDMGRTRRWTLAAATVALGLVGQVSARRQNKRRRGARMGPVPFLVTALVVVWLIAAAVESLTELRARVSKRRRILRRRSIPAAPAVVAATLLVGVLIPAFAFGRPEVSSGIAAIGRTAPGPVEMQPTPDPVEMQPTPGHPGSGTKSAQASTGSDFRLEQDGQTPDVSDEPAAAPESAPDTTHPIAPAEAEAAIVDVAGVVEGPAMLSAQVLETPAPHEPPGAARSWYVAWLSGDPAIDRDVAYLRACDQARHSPAGLVVVSFGRQVAGGATGFMRNASVPYTTLVDASNAFARGLHDCSSPDATWLLSLGTSNNGGATAHNGFDGGRLWGELVEATAALSSDLRVEVVGGIDMEPAWGPIGQARSWLDGFAAATGRMLVNFGSADGCPRAFEPGAECANGWTLDDMVHVASGASSALWMAPEVYDRRGIMAAQWATIAAHGSNTGKPVRFLGVVSQQGACRTVQDPNCARLDNSPEDAWRQFADALGAYPGIAFHPPHLATDIDW
jgi:hypothetical protein